MKTNKHNAALNVGRLGLLVLLALWLILPTACRRQKESENKLPQRDINLVMADHANELMAIPGVTGVAIGELEDHTPCILVLVEKESNEIRRVVPKILEGHPVRLYVSGKIVPMDKS